MTEFYFTLNGLLFKWSFPKLYNSDRPDKIWGTLAKGILRKLRECKQKLVPVTNVPQILSGLCNLGKTFLAAVRPPGPGRWFGVVSIDHLTDWLTDYSCQNEKTSSLSASPGVGGLQQKFISHCIVFSSVFIHSFIHFWVECLQRWCDCLIVVVFLVQSGLTGWYNLGRRGGKKSCRFLPSCVCVFPGYIIWHIPRMPRYTEGQDLIGT